jgi:hypothetical protein
VICWGVSYVQQNPVCLSFFYNSLGSIYDIGVIFFGPRGGHGPPWPPFSSASKN